MVFTQYGFKTGNVILPGIELDVDFSPNRFFRNDGIVSNLKEHTDKVFRDIGHSLDYTHNFDSLHGICNTVDYTYYEYTALNPYLACCIYILDVTPVINLFTLGHESTHAVINLGVKNQFLYMLKDEGFSLDPFTKFTNNEAIAHVGGVLALYKHYKKWDFFEITDPLVNRVRKELFDSKIPIISTYIPSTTRS
ncbi:MAG: hypothetical protein ACP5N1_07330 [Candidatus Woesearchaeota archaeon]